MSTTLFVNSTSRLSYGISTSHHFTIKFTPPVIAGKDYGLTMAFDRAKWHFSWHNIKDGNNNNKIKYSPMEGDRIL